MFAVASALSTTLLSSQMLKVHSALSSNLFYNLFCHNQTLFADTNILCFIDWIISLIFKIFDIWNHVKSIYSFSFISTWCWTEPGLVRTGWQWNCWSWHWQHWLSWATHWLMVSINTGLLRSTYYCLVTTQQTCSYRRNMIKWVGAEFHAMMINLFTNKIIDLRNTLNYSTCVLASILSILS